MRPSVSLKSLALIRQGFSPNLFEELVLPRRIISCHSHLYEFISLESHRRLNYELPVLCVVLESGSVDVAERHVVLRGKKQNKT